MITLSPDSWARRRAVIFSGGSSCCELSRVPSKSRAIALNALKGEKSDIKKPQKTLNFQT
jgi:hypothetical protein